MERNVNDPDLELRLGQPGAEVDDGLSPVERRIQFCFSIYEPRREIPLDDIQAIVQLKTEIIKRMAELDPHSFLTDHSDRILLFYSL